MDELCERMENMMERFNVIVGSLDGLRQNGFPAKDVQNHRQMDHIAVTDQPPLDGFMFSDAPEQSGGIENRHMEGVEVQLEHENEDEDEDLSEVTAPAVQDHVMTRDSYGKLRYA